MRTLLLLAVAALVAAAPQGNRSRPFGPGRCGPIDPSYVRVANETGGQPFPMAPAEMAHMAQVMSEKSRSDRALVLWAHGSAAESDPPHGVPVDASISRLTFSITFDGTGGTATITAPDGRAMQASAGTEDTVLNCGRFLIVDAPAVGSWQVAVRPSQRFWLVVHARSEIDLLAAEFVAPGGRAGHEGLFRIEGQPVRGRPAILRARTSGPERMKAPSFLLLSLDGRPLQHVDLPRVDEDEFAGQIDLPAVPFRVAVAETDAGYQRVRRGLFHAELVEVRPDPADTIPAGEETALVYTIRNHGPAARFRIQATFGSRILDRVEPAVIEIPPGGEEAVTLRLTPLASESGQTLRLIVLATSEGTALPTSNSSVRELRVGQALAGPRPHLH